MNGKNLFIFLCILMAIISAGCVSAAEDADVTGGTDIADSEMEDALSQSNDDEVGARPMDDEMSSASKEDKLAVGERNFTDLQNLFNGPVNEITLNDNYVYTSGDEASSLDRIIIDKKVRINGNGHTINAMGKSGIFEILSDCNSLTLHNMTIMNSNSYALGFLNPGNDFNLTLIDVNFTQNSCIGVVNINAGSGTVNLNCSGVDFADNNAVQGIVYIRGEAVNVVSDNMNFTDNNVADKILNINGGFVNLTYMEGHFINNIAEKGIAYIDGTGSSAIFNNMKFINNTVRDGKGGAVTFLMEGNNPNWISIANATFNNNTASHGGAVYIYSNQSGSNLHVNISLSAFENNTAATGGAVYILADDLILRCEDTDFVKNTLFHLDKYDYKGGALYVNATAANALFRNATFAYNGVSDLSMASSGFLGGGAISFVSLNDRQNCINFTDSRVINNTGFYGGGIYLYGLTVADMYFNNTNFTGNVAVTGGAMNFNQMIILKLYLTGVNLADNFADGSGGAIGLISHSSRDCDLHVWTANTTFEKNHAYSAGAMFVSSATPSCNFTLNCTGTEFRDNKADYTAGAFDIEGCIAHIINVTFTNNTAAERGGAINNWASMTLTDSTFKNNTAVNGGAVYNWVNLTGIRNSFEGNTAVNGGAVYNGNEHSPAVMTLKDNSFAANTAVNGGAVYNVDNITVIHNSFANNTAGGNGGAVAIHVNNANHFDFDVKSAIFINNTAGGNGGAVSISSNNVSTTKVSMTTVKFINNTAGENGGALFVNSTNASDEIEFNIQGPLFEDNAAGGNGGAIAIQKDLGKSLLILAGPELYNNAAGADGGALYYNSTGDSKLTLRNANFLKNTAFRGGAMSLENIWGTVNTVELLGNRANSTDLTYVHENDQLTVTFSGNENYLNAIYAKGCDNLDFEEDVIYWNGTAVQTTGSEQFNASVNESGIDIVLEIDNNGTLINLTTDKSGQVHFSTLGLSDGIHTFRVFHAEDDYYTFIERTGQFMVQSVVTNLTVSVENIVYGQNATVNVTLTDINGNNMTGVDVNVTIDSKIYIIHIENGKGSINNVSGLAAGVNYLANATFGGIPSFGASNATDYFNVTKAQSLIEIYKINNVAYGEAVRVMFNVTDVANVTYVVQKRDGTPVVPETVVLNLNATDNVIVLALGAGNYTITITGAGNENYTGDVFAAPFTVYKGDLAVGVAAENITPLDNGKVNITSIPSDFVGNVSIVVDGVTVYNGTPASSIDIGRFSVGNKTAKVTFYGDDNYAVRTVDANFTVNKVDSSVAISPIGNVTYPDPVVINFTVSNASDVNWTIVNKDTGESFNGTGLNNITQSLPAGNYTVTIESKGNDNVTGFVTSADFTVNKVNSSVVISEINNVTYPDPVVINFTASNATEVNWTIVNKDTGESFNGTGLNNITQSLPAGNYTVTIESKGNDNVTGFVTSADFTVNKAASSIVISPIGNVTYPDPVVINFTVSNASDVNWTIVNKDNGESFNGTGLNNIAQSLPAGNYTVTIESKGNDNVTGFVTSADFTVNKVNSSVVISEINNVTYPDPVVINFTASNATEVNWTIVNKDNGESFNGTGLNNITQSLPAGNYTVTIESKGNDNVTGFVTSADFTVNKAVSSIVISPIGNVTYPDATVINFTVVNATVVNWTIVNKDTKEVINGSGLDNITRALAAGNYTVTIENANTVNVTGFVVSADFTVNKAVSSIVISPIGNVTYPDATVINFTVVNDTVVNWTIVNKDTKEVINGSGLDNIARALAAGNYTVTIENANTVNVTGFVTSADFTVDKAASSVVIDSVGNVTYPDATVINFTVVNDTVVNWTIVNKDTKEIINGTGLNNITRALAAGNYTITIENANTVNITGYVASADFSVNKVNSSVVISEINNVTYPDPVVINFTASNATEVNWTIVNKDTGESFNGTGLNNITQALAAGNYTVTIESKGNDNVTGFVTSADFTVNKAASSIVIAPIGNVTYPDATVINFTVVNDTVVNWTIVNKDTKEIINGTGLDNITRALAAGNYTITIENADTVNITGSVASSEFTVFKAPSSVSADNVNVTYGDLIVVHVSSENAVNVTYEILDESGKAVANGTLAPGENITGLKLDVGNYTVNLATVVDDNHIEANYVSNITVSKISDYEMNVSLDSPHAGDNATVTVNVPENATGNVTVTLSNGTNYTGEIKDGVATVNVSNLPAGDNNVTVTYPGDVKYAGITSNAIIHVQGIVIDAKDMKRGWDSPYDYLAKVKYEDGTPVVNKTVVFAIDGKEYKATTDDKGVAKLTDLKLDVGTYNVTVIFKDTGDNVTHKLKIVKRIVENKDLTMDYKDGHKFIVRAIGDDGNPVGKDVVVSIKINGKTYKVKTDEKGYAKLAINLIPKKYTATSTYHKYSVKNTVTVKQILKLVKKTVSVKKGKNVVLKATLKKSNGKPIKGKTIKFRLCGKIFKAKTNSKGLAKATVKDKKVLKKLKKGKKYNYSASYVKDIVKGKVKVK